MPHKLLLADDSVTIQRVIELTFADEDVDVVAVGDGAQAIEKITAEPPDIVLADTGMPERDGYEVAEFVKRDVSRRHIPVVLLTGAFEPVDEARAESIGCNGVLVKPFEPQQVVAKVRELLAAGAVRDTASAAAVEAEATRQSMVETGDVVVAASAGTAATPSLGDDELIGYLDQLDEVFSGLEAVVPPAPAAARAPSAPASPERPADTSVVAPEPEPLVSEAPEEAAATDFSTDGGEWDLESFVKSVQAESAASAPSAAPPAVESAPAVPPVTTPAPSMTVPPASSEQPARPTPPARPEPLARSAPPAPPKPPVRSEPPAPTTMAVAPAEGEQTVLAQAFSTFLAAEQGVPLPAAPAATPATGSSGPELTDQMVDEVVGRVVERLTDRVLRETTAEIVSRVAEQLVREEIDRIKSLS